MIRDAKKRIKEMLGSYFTAKELEASLKDQVKKAREAWEEENKTLLASQSEAGATFRKYNTAIRAAILNVWLKTGESEIIQGVTIQQRWSTEITGKPKDLVEWAMRSDRHDLLVVDEKKLKDMIKLAVIQDSESDEQAEMYLQALGLSSMVNVTRTPTPVIKNVSIAS